MADTNRSVWTAMAVFFIPLGIGLFLGDGQQAAVDLAGLLVALVFYATTVMTARRTAGMPGNVRIAWIALLAYFAASTLWSDDAGFSISVWLRYAAAYFVCDGFARLRGPGVRTAYDRSLTAFSLFALAAAVAVPRLSAALPLSSMNLLRIVGGQNHVANILLFAFPIAVSGIWSGHHRAAFVILAGIILAGIGCSLSRGALAVAAVALVPVMPIAFRQGKRYGFAVLASLAITVGLFFAINGAAVGGNRSGLFAGTTVVKKPLGEDGRPRYWEQAVRAIRERPVFGAGPGTFSLQSRRLQRSPGAYSWFAHSYPLQLTAETGVVGLALTGYLALRIIGVIRRRRQGAALRGGHVFPGLPPYGWGVLLVLILSLIDYPLDFFIVWLLVWAGVGMFLGQTADPAESDGFGLDEAAGFGIGCLIVLILSTAEWAVFRIPSLPLWGPVYRQEAVRTSLYNAETAGSKVDGTFLTVASAFHRKNPDTIADIAGYLAAEGRMQPADAAYARAVSLDPKNPELYRRWAAVIAGPAVSAGRLRWYRLYAANFLPVSTDFALTELAASDTETIAAGMKMLLDERLNHELRFSKFYYMLGLKSADTNPKRTEVLWRLAITLSPDLSYYYLELASLQLHRLHDVGQADATLRLCGEQVYPRRHCLTQTLVTLPDIGRYGPQIAAFPQIP
jgi:O-antigen ligase